MQCVLSVWLWDVLYQFAMRGICMDQNILIRMATVDDLAAMLAIYTPYVENTPISFEYVPPTLQEFTARFYEITLRFPWLTAEVNGVVCGYAYAKPSFSRSAYMWNAEVSVYVADGFQRMKLGERMLNAVTGLLMQQGYCKAYGLISARNLASVRLLEKIGFAREGCLCNVGFKHGEWHDILWMGKLLRPLPQVPEKPVACSELPAKLLLAGEDAWRACATGEMLSS